MDSDAGTFKEQFCSEQCAMIADLRIDNYELRRALCIYLREYSADEYMGIDIHELASQKGDIEKDADNCYIKAFIEIMEKTASTLSESGGEDWSGYVEQKDKVAIMKEIGKEVSNG